MRTSEERGVGPMGSGGRMNLVGVNRFTANFVLASYFVSVSYIH